MTIRMNEEQSSKSHLPPETRSNQGPMSSNVTDEGCPVIESGTVCGETKTLSIIREFREIYENCVQNMEQCSSDSLKKLEPFRKLVDNLWEQNAMLVETVQELEHEATCRVAMLQERLNQSNEKADLIQSDVNALIEVIRRFRDKGILDSSGLNFNTLCDAEIYGKCRDICSQRICKEGKCRTRHQLQEVGQKFDVKPASSVTPQAEASLLSYEQREEMLVPSKIDSSSLSYKPSQLSQVPSKPGGSNVSFRQSRISQGPNPKTSTLSYRPSKVSQRPSKVESSYVEAQESNTSQLKVNESSTSYEPTSYMDLPSKVETSTSMDKISTISQSTSTGFVDDEMKSYSKMNHAEDLNHMRPININLKLIREPVCCVTSNQCCDCECEPECKTCVCDCDY